jgi:hypothetical protein
MRRGTRCMTERNDEQAGAGCGPRRQGESGHEGSTWAILPPKSRIRFCLGLPDPHERRAVVDDHAREAAAQLQVDPLDLARE